MSLLRKLKKKIQVMLRKILSVILLTCLLSNAFAQQKKTFNNNWDFFKDKDTVFLNNLLLENGEVKWQKVSLPHTANIEPIVKVNQQ